RRWRNLSLVMAGLDPAIPIADARPSIPKRDHRVTDLRFGPVMTNENCYSLPRRRNRETPMDDTVRKITAEDINPRYNWGRALPAFGTMGVDFEQRVDYRRLHNYRLARARQALEKSDLGALLVMDVNNIRYLTSTKIGEWERDKICRWALLTRGSADPILW